MSKIKVASFKTAKTLRRSIDSIQEITCSVMFMFLSAFKKAYNGNSLGTEHRLNDGSSFFKPLSFQLVINPPLVPKAFDCSMFNSWRLHRLLPVKICKCKLRIKLTSLHFWPEMSSLLDMCMCLEKKDSNSRDCEHILLQRKRREKK